MTQKEAEVAYFLANFAQEDGAHHLRWAICEAMRMLMGEEEYRDFVEEYQAPQKMEHSDDTWYSEWDEGIAP